MAVLLDVVLPTVQWKAVTAASHMPRKQSAAKAKDKRPHLPVRRTSLHRHAYSLGQVLQLSLVPCPTLGAVHIGRYPIMQ